MRTSITASKITQARRITMPNLRLASIRQVCLVFLALTGASGCWQRVAAKKSDNHQLMMPAMVEVVDKSPMVVEMKAPMMVEMKAPVMMEMKSPHGGSSHEAKMEPMIEMVAMSGKPDHSGKEMMEVRMDKGQEDLSALGGHKKYVLVKKKPKHKKIKMEVYKPKMKYKKIKIKVPVKKMKKKKVKGYMIKKEHDHYS